MMKATMLKKMPSYSISTHQTAGTSSLPGRRAFASECLEGESKMIRAVLLFTGYNFEEFTWTPMHPLLFWPVFWCRAIQSIYQPFPYPVEQRQLTS
jgi:hypothetical protein